MKKPQIKSSIKQWTTVYLSDFLLELTLGHVGSARVKHLDNLIFSKQLVRIKTSITKEVATHELTTGQQGIAHELASADLDG